MSSGNYKDAFRWNHATKRWQRIWYHAVTGELIITNGYLGICKRCSRPAAIYKHSRGCSVCESERRRVRDESWKEANLKQSRGHAAVHTAIRDGVLADLRHVEIKCTDCAARAVCYDHRDYSKPLDVEPVCRSCNVRRGPAIDIAHLVTRKSKRRAPSM